MTYDEAKQRLGSGYTQFLWHHRKIEDCVATVERLKQSCLAQGLTERADAYAAVAKVMCDVAKKGTHHDCP